MELQPWPEALAQLHIIPAGADIKTSKGPVHVYWIRGRQTNSDHLYFVIDGGPLVYAVSGELMPEFFTAILAHLVITPEP